MRYTMKFVYVFCVFVFVFVCAVCASTALSTKNINFVQVRNFGYTHNSHCVLTPAPSTTAKSHLCVIRNVPSYLFDQRCFAGDVILIIFVSWRSVPFSEILLFLSLLLCVYTHTNKDDLYRLFCLYSPNTVHSRA